MATSTSLRDYVLDPLERAASTFVQQFVVLLIPTMVVADDVVKVTNYGIAADIAGFAALISLLTSILTFKVPVLPIGWDLTFRVIKTFIQSLAGTLTADQVTPSLVHANWHSALGIALVVSMTALLKGLASIAAPWSHGASLLPVNAGVVQVNEYKGEHEPKTA
jgi:hypothetical protein